MHVADAIAARFSARAFLPTPVPREPLERWCTWVGFDEAPSRAAGSG